MNARVENLTQGSFEWHAHRAQFDNASEAAAALGISPFFPKTPRQLWEVRRGTAQVFVSPAMTRGTEFEDKARQNAADSLGMDFEPAVFTRNHYSASLDGISACGTVALEIKIPAKGQASDLWKCVQRGDGAPDHYLAQMSQQLHCSGAKEVVFWVYDPDADLGMAYRLTAEELSSMWNRVRAAWEAFRAAQDAMEPPPPMVDDEVEVVDRDVLMAADELIVVRREIAAFTAREEVLEKKLKELIPNTHISTMNTASGHLRAQWITRTGAVDYAKVPQLKGVELDAFRKKPTTYLKLSVQ